jgi:hypothetical protein
MYSFDAAIAAHGPRSRCDPRHGEPRSHAVRAWSSHGRGAIKAPTANEFRPGRFLPAAVPKIVPAPRHNHAFCANTSQVTPGRELAEGEEFRAEKRKWPSG